MFEDYWKRRKKLSLQCLLCTVLTYRASPRTEYRNLTLTEQNLVDPVLPTTDTH